jgi:cyclopropane-fatty-acyl-phospholipid synthase
MNATQRASSNPGSAQSAVEHHYDTSNAFFQLWLDPTMTYSGAAFLPGDTLEQAQLRKIDHHLVQSNCRGAERLLDIGCGWGATLARAICEQGVRNAIGLTFSPNQAQYIRDHHIGAAGLTGLEVRVESWSDHAPQAPYDAIVSIGAIEHFARPELSRREKIAAYRSLFERCHRWLRPGGKFSLQTVTWNGLARENASEFMLTDVFPETDPPELSELSDAMKGLFELELIVCDRAGYTQTLNAWWRNLRRARAEAEAIVGPDVVQRFERYLGVCAIAFHSHNLNLMRLTLARLS